MRFPAYVPGAVRDYITPLIEGKKPSWEGLAVSLAEAEQQLSEIRQTIEIRTSRNEIEYLFSLQKQEAEAQKNCSLFAEDLECLQRLIHDARMREVYALLTLELSDDEQWCCLIDAAYVARGDFADWRSRLKQADEAKEKIADAANKLADLIDNFSKNGVAGPSEFYSIRDLLRITDWEESLGNNRYIWQAARKDVVGDVEPKKSEPDERHQFDLPLSEFGQGSDDLNIQGFRIRFVSSQDLVEHDPLAGLRYGWEKAPQLPALLRTVAKAARDFETREEGMIGAAVNTRQGSIKTAYVRALAYLLLVRHKFALTNRLMRAMAIIANVVINSRDVDVTYDDVRKALASPMARDWKTPGKK